MSVVNRRLIPLTVVGGYLGAGKTTLLNHLLRYNDGRRLAVIVNDFGSINIDAELIENQDGDTINLANGCICCSLADNFSTTLMNLLQMATPPDQIVIEASGVADPVKLGQYGYYPGLQLDGILVLIDAEQIQEKATNKYVGEMVIRQIQGADLLVLNKVDLVTPEKLASVKAWITELEPDARILETAFGELPLTPLLGLRENHLPSADDMSPPAEEDHSHVDHNHPEVYQTWSLSSSKPIQKANIRNFLDKLPEGVLRAKGIVFLDEDPDQRYLLQLVGKRWTLKPSESWGNRQPETRLVFIGISASIDEEQFEAVLRGE